MEFEKLCVFKKSLSLLHYVPIFVMIVRNVLVEQVRDQSLSRLKSKIELMYVTNGYEKVVVVPHSMGVLYFLHFVKWVEAPPPMGGGGGPGWCAKYIKSIVNIGPTFLGVAKSVSTLLSSESKDVASLRLVLPPYITIFTLHSSSLSCMFSLIDCRP